ncbi:MAG TPA: type 4a pilus biogenesis protein PilO [Actinomycetota bacterium]|nr:type 4a pilus biogenesis protein PilO [Actinomycetota bacterium]
MTGRTRLILWIVGAILACLLLYYFGIRPQRAELADVRAQIEAEEIRETQLAAELRRLQELQANAPELQAELAEIRRFVPVKPELANLIFQVQESANRAGLDFVTITPELPRTPPEGATLAQVRATIGGAGGYFALQDFLRRLHTLDRALRVDTMAINVGSLEPFGTRLTMTIAARVFYELPDPVVDTTATNATPGTAPSPTASPATTP